jgi:anhydro-N-acetylmuramic acid kinase
MRVVGLMSGTSADGVDAALVEWPDDAAVRPFRMLAYREMPLAPELQKRVHELAAGRVPASAALREQLQLDSLLADQFAEAALAVAELAGVAPAEVDAIASHGQTIAHYPEDGVTLQIGAPSRIAERTGVDTIGNFRVRDMAAGGEGAPLAPFFHWSLLTDASEDRLVLNLGGMANVTWLPRGARPEDVLAFDVGPANSLIDAVVQRVSAGAERFDRGGARARRGELDPALLERLLDDEFLRRPPPKSTGRERYGLAEAERLVDEAAATGRATDDLVATLVAFSARAVGQAVDDFLPASPQRVWLVGGGARNAALVAALTDVLAPARVEPLDAAGISADAVEAMAFSLMGRNALLELPNHLPRCTGARHAAVLGEWALARTGRRRAP